MIICAAGEFRCPLCNRALEAFDGSSEIAYRITVAPEVPSNSRALSRGSVNARPFSLDPRQCGLSLRVLLIDLSLPNDLSGKLRR